MSEIPSDLPYKIRWDKDFESDVEELKSSGSFDEYRKQIIEIIKQPIRTGKYKDGDYKGLKTAHVSGNYQDVICFELIPGVNHQSEKPSLEKVYLWHIDHWDNYDSALRSQQPADVKCEFEVEIPYMRGQYDPERVRSDIYDLCTGVDWCSVAEDEWREEYIWVAGEIGPDNQEELADILPESVTVDFTTPEPF